MYKIEAGLWDRIKRSLNKLWDMFDNLAEHGMKILEEEEKDGELRRSFYTAENKKYTIATKLEPHDPESNPEGADLYTVRVFDDRNYEKMQEHLRKEEVQPWVEKTLKIYFHVHLENEIKRAEEMKKNQQKSQNQQNPQEATAAKKMSISLQRVCGAKEDRINLIGIKGNYNPKEMQENLKQITASDDLMALVTEEPVTIDVIDDGTSELDCSVCEDPQACLNPEESIEVACDMILAASLNCQNLMKYIHWNAHGEQFKDIHEIADTIYWLAHDLMDNISEHRAQCGLPVKDMAAYLTKSFTEEPMTFGPETSGQGAFQAMKDCTDALADTLDCYMCNFDDSYMQTLKCTSADIRKQADYFVGKFVQP